MRILHAAGGTAVQELNWRYRKVPTFGRGTIRRFHKNASAMKRLAARDFEDLLQCAIPVFEGLLPAPHNDIVLDLLFDLATWQGFAKLRMHTDDTLAFFDTATTTLSKSMRKFARHTCMYYHTTELPQEYAARGRRQAAIAAKQPQTSGPGPGVKATPTVTPKIKKLNLSTYKYHALGDYPNTIRRYGTTDSYSTQMGELEHRCSKRRFPRSGKKKGTMVTSMANQEAIERFIRKVNAARVTLAPGQDILHSTRCSRTSPSEHYHIAASSRQGHDLTVWLGDRRNDPAVENFIPQLKDHFLARLRGMAYNGDEYDFSDQDRDCILFHDNKFFEHSVLQINYTTYDLRRDQDSINPRTRADIMVLSQEDERSHPYWYARVTLIFHIMVEYRKDPTSTYSRPSRMDVLFVRWFQRDTNFDVGWNAKRPFRLQFFDQHNISDAFGFVNPDSVVRSVHLIPVFALGSTDELLGPSFVRQERGTEGWDFDWRYFYVNM
ncbi:hypothetical protein PAXINDRAFT_15944 [Paxillus involutus ATCC 200175]|uniref:Uncharacterized protein n=1 Tax=Paxillus involutus ATCC 200175 TaxID=664439 RepID=A0A0C9SSD8_PAXIN|nr:hypothetical protein PAXINDRAFT_15944 [Paxillus involutus ATCC 200175]